MPSSRIFSFNAKVGVTFDVSRVKSNCINSCFAKEYCYNEYGQEKINHLYQLKLNRNYNLISSKRFVKSVKREIMRLNLGQLRIFSDGDIIYNNTDIAKIQLSNIFELCNSMNRKDFWITTRNQNELFKFLSLGNTKPDNLNILLSVKKESLTPGFLNYCKSLKIQVSYITDKKTESNCKASTSKNKKSCYENNCNLCLTYDDKPRVWFIHGRGKGYF